MARSQLPILNPIIGPITLGRAGTLIDYSAWHERCQGSVGRPVEFAIYGTEVHSTHLNEIETWNLGFKAAALGFNAYDKIKHKQ